MGLYLGLDIGTTTLSVVVVDVEGRGLLYARTVAHEADATAAVDKARGWAEVDLDRVGQLLMGLLADAVQGLGQRRDALQAVGVTGQQHGMALLDAANRPLRSAITWQDRRVLEQVPGRTETYLEQFIRRAGGVPAFARMGCLPSRGYLGPTLSWLQQRGELPDDAAAVCFVPDYAVARLTGQPPVCDPTNGGSSGVMDVVDCQWDWEMIARLGLPARLFPQVRLPGAVVGELAEAVCARLGIERRLPVCVALGDNQASVFGAQRDPEQSLSLNVGTGAQISAVIGEYRYLPTLQTRYFPGGRYLLVGAGLFGGRSYAYLRDLFRQVGQAFYGGQGDEALYDQMTQLAEAVPAGCDGLRCSPLFTGSLLEPTLRASYTGITPQNLSPGHLTRALLEGMAEVFCSFYQEMLPTIGARAQLVGSGNGICLNRLFRRILAERFGLPLAIPALPEAAATGAALIAAVGVKELADLRAASHWIRYTEGGDAV